MTPSLPFFERLSLASRSFLQILGDPAWALSVKELNQPPKLEAPSPSEAAPANKLEAFSPAGQRVSDPSAALQLLSILQRHGRFLDFVQQDPSTFSDAEVGQVARVVHAGCKKALDEHFALVPVRSENEGQRVTVADALEARKVKLTGNVAGSPPYSGVLKHRGWQTTCIELPELMPGAEARVLAMAEVEL